MFIRYSTEQDKEQIHELIMLDCVGRGFNTSLENLRNRYLLAFDEDNLVGMADIIWVEETGEYKLNWTFTHPKYHKRILRMNYSKEYIH